MKAPLPSASRVSLLLDSTIENVNPPELITRDNYRGWLNGIQSNKNEFFELMFNWYEGQFHTPLPSLVDSDPDKLYIEVNSALRDTINLEAQGDIGAGIAMGFDAYGIVDVPASVGIEAMLFFCGKPVGQREGDTYPVSNIFTSSHFSMHERWGQGNYFSSNSQTGGGLVRDLNDDNTVLVRGRVEEGYTIFSSFFGPSPGKHTATVAQLFIAILRSRPDGLIELRYSLRREGQSYAMFGLEYGRREYGFNARKFRTEAKSLIAGMVELKNTGKIVERRPH